MIEYFPENSFIHSILFHLFIESQFRDKQHSEMDITFPAYGSQGKYTTGLVTNKHDLAPVKKQLLIPLCRC